MIHLLGKQVDAAIAAFLQLIHQAVCDPVNAPLGDKQFTHGNETNGFHFAKVFSMICLVADIFASSISSTFSYTTSVSDIEWRNVEESNILSAKPRPPVRFSIRELNPKLFREQKTICGKEWKNCCVERIGHHHFGILYQT